MKSKLLIFVLLPFVISCVSHKAFVDYRNNSIGRPLWHVSVPKPYRITQIDDDKSEYFYEYKNTGCQWAYFVDNKTQNIISWQFISSPDLCYFRTGFYN